MVWAGLATSKKYHITKKSGIDLEVSILYIAAAFGRDSISNSTLIYATFTLRGGFRLRPGR